MDLSKTFILFFIVNSEPLFPVWLEWPQVEEQRRPKELFGVLAGVITQLKVQPWQKGTVLDKYKCRVSVTTPDNDTALAQSFVM